MTEYSDMELADLYVRDKLTVEEETELEVRLLKNKELQQHILTALTIRESYRVDEMLNGSIPEVDQTKTVKEESSWRPMALAASVMLAVVSTVMWGKTSFDVSQYKSQVARLSQPQTSILSVPVNIMRSSGSATPDVIVQKPKNGSIMQLNIELSGKSSSQPTLQFSMINDGQETVLSWQDSPSEGRYSTVLLRSEQVPAGLLQLQVSSLNGDILDRHLMEFRHPLD